MKSLLSQNTGRSGQLESSSRQFPLSYSWYRHNCGTWRVSNKFSQNCWTRWPYQSRPPWLLVSGVSFKWFLFWKTYELVKYFQLNNKYMKFIVKSYWEKCWKTLEVPSPTPFNLPQSFCPKATTFDSPIPSYIYTFANFLKNVILFSFDSSVLDIMCWFSVLIN